MAVKDIGLTWDGLLDNSRIRQLADVNNHFHRRGEGNNTYIVVVYR